MNVELTILGVAVLNFIVTLSFIFLIRRKIKEIPGLFQEALDAVGEAISEQFSNPTIKKAYSILGKQSGETRADEALRSKVADKVIGQSPVIEKVLDYFGITPLEGIRLMNDPLFGPMIKGFIGGGGPSPTHGPGGYGTNRKKTKFRMEYG